MRQRRLFWCVLGVLVVLASWLFLRRPDRQTVATPPSSPAAAGATSASASAALPAGFTLANNRAAIAAAATRTALFQRRVSNTPARLDDLTRNERAVLLRNALIDTTLPLDLAIPPQFRASSNTASYIVQARGVITDAFREVLRSAGASNIAYIPNNAFLVRLKAENVAALRASPVVTAVLPFEPFYKVDARLFDERFAQYRVLSFPGEEAALVQAVEGTGAKVLGREKTALGTILTVQGNDVDVATLARIDELEVIEPKVRRARANAMVRPAIGVTADGTTTTNYLGLTGTNIMVAIPDSGLDINHPDLTPRAVVDLAGTAQDTDGHGTLAAGIIASSGKNSTNLLASGSPAGSDFRGMAPGARLYGMRAVGADEQSDAYLQEQASITNALISNNSWNYIGAFDYDLAAASYDAAMRDAQPDKMGSQPMLFVFAAGNSGFGSANGQGGESGSIASPATSKNGISVAASEMLRNITNEVLRTNFSLSVGTNGTNIATVTTNQPWAGETDTRDEVAPFSSRGNVGAGTEGERGRFKPDVVAPGVFVVSTRSDDWNEQSYYNPTNYSANRFRFQLIESGQQANFSIFVPANAVGLYLQVLPNNLTPVPMPALQIYVRQAARPTTNVFDVLGTNLVAIPPDHALSPVDTTWFYNVRNPGTNGVSVDIRTIIATTNDLGNYYTVLSNLNESLDTNHLYRYESGTSMAAPAVSGMLALMEEFFEQRMQPLYNPTNRPSPALLKALVINGARSLGTLYNLSVSNSINYQGWGLVNLSNSLPASLSNRVGQAATDKSFVFYDQHQTNALTTGQSRTRRLKLTEEARIQPLRFTLVWTDPPGNPVAGPKLVNDLDLVVTNLDTGDVYFGNDIPAGQDFNQASITGTTNGTPNPDVINNVENVFLNAPLGSNYSVSVVARRVNVNAVTAQTNGIAQDFALVVSSGDAGTLTNAFTVTDDATIVFTNAPHVTIVATNGVPLLNQHVGANHALITTTNGTSNQWHFFVYTNATSFTNVAFVTFLPPELSVPRIGTREVIEENATRIEADLDLYVSTDPSLLNLNPQALAAARKSLSGGGTENVILSNALANQVFYVGVKAEDQMAAEFGFLAVSSEEPFSSLDAEGNQHVRGLTLPVLIPDGSPSQPGGALVFALAAYPMKVRKAVVTNTITHQEMGDLLGNLSHGQDFAVLNNHRPGAGGGLVPQTYVYDDQGGIPGALTTDGPGSLRNFVGEEGAGVWLLAMVDNSLNQTGRVDLLNIRLEPIDEDLGVTNFITIQAQQFYFDAIDVPPEATNLTVILGDNTAPLELYIRRDAFPTRTQYDKFALINPPGGSLSVTLFDVPPLTAGRYYIGIYNPNATPQVNVQYVKLLFLAATPASAGNFLNVGATPLTDDAVSRSSILITTNETIARAEVGVVIEHPRIADLALTLISPTGKRILLSENRGWLSTNGYGSFSLKTNVSPRSANGGPAADTNTIAVGANSGTLQVAYEFHPIPDVMQVFYDGAKIFDTGLVSGPGNFTVNFGPGASTDLTIVMNAGDNTNTDTRWEYVATVVSGTGAYAIFTDDTKKTVTPIKFAVPPFAPNPVAVTVWGSDFEVAATNYPAGTVVDAWTVVSNSVDVVDDGAFANTGQKYLQLGKALIGQTLPAVVGRRYTLTYAYRKAPDTNVANNLVLDGSFEPFIAQFYNAPANLGAWVVTANPLTTNNSVEVDDGRLGAPFWNGADGVKSADLDGDVGQAGAIHQDVVTIAGQSYRLRYALAGNYVNAPVVKTMRVSVGGVNFGTNTFDTTGHDAANMGWVYYETNFTATAARTRILFESLTGSGWGPVIDDVSVTPAPAALVSLNNLTNRLVAGSNWQTNSISLTAAGSTVTISALGLEAGVAVDSFTLQEQPGAIYYLPESGLSSLIGDSSQGTWTLEVWDTRVGATNVVTPKIAGWKLDLAFANTVPLARPLIHAVVVTDTISPGSIHYYYVDVPLWASYATNILTTTSTNSSLLRFFNINGLPRQNVPTDIPLAPTPGTNTFSSSTVPTLAPGSRYYLAVQNTGPSATYSISVEFDITQLTNAVSLVATQGGFRPRYYSFDVSTNAVAVLFETLNANGNVDMVVRYGAPLPDLVDFDYASTNAGTNNEFILVITNSSPVPLTPGRWFIGVFNQDPGAVDYTIRVTELTSIDPVIIDYSFTTNSLCLTWTSVPGFSYYVVGKVNLEDPLWVPVSPTIVAIATNTTYCIPLPTPYRFFDIRVGVAPSAPDPDQPVDIPANGIAYFEVPVPDWPYAATNTLLSATLPVDLLFNQNGLPTGSAPGDFTLLSNTNGGVFVLTTNSTPDLRTNRTYYLGLRNTNSVPVQARLQVEFNSTQLTNGISLRDTLLSSIPRYFYLAVPPGSVAAFFQIYNLNANSDIVIREDGYGIPTLNSHDHDYASTNLGTVNDGILLTTNSTPFPLTATNWNISVYNRTALPAGYTVRASATSNAEPDIILYEVGTNGLCLTWHSLPGLNYYVGGKVNLDDPEWTPVSPTLVAEEFTTTYCIPFPTPYQFFEVFIGTVPTVTIPDPDVPVVIQPNDTAYFRVPVADWPYAATNTILSATLPVDLVFNQNSLPTAAASGNVTLLANALNGVSTLLTNGSPPLLTNRNYYLGLRNNNPAPVTVSLRVEFNTTLLTNAVELSDTLPSTIPRYFSFAVPPGSTTADFEIYNLTTNSDLVIRDIGFPTLTANDYGSFNLGTTNELVTVTTASLPRPLTTNIWNLSVYNRTTGAAGYTVRVTATNTDPVIVDTQISSNSLCLTWTSVPGTNYYVVGKVELTDTNWVPVSPVITATSNLTTYCVTLPNSNHFFDVFVGTPPVTPPPPSGPPVIIDTTINSNGLCLTWTSIPGTNYYVVGKVELTDTNWVPVSPVITATGTQTTYCVTLPNTNHFFDVVVTVPPVVPPTPPGPPVVTGIQLSSTNLCLTWSSIVGTNYQVVGKVELTDTNWVPVSPVITATGTQSTYCVTLPNTNHFFDVIVTVPPVVPPTPPGPPVVTGIHLSSTNLCLTWTSIPGTNYYVVGKVELTDTNWVPVSPAILATNSLTTYCVTLPNSNHFFDVIVTVPPVLPPTPPGPPVVTGIQISATNLCLTWSSIAGTNYYVVGKVELTDTNWVPVSPVITATNNLTSYCVTLPNTNHFFDVVVTTPPVVPPTPPTPPVVTGIQLSSTNLCLTWSSIAGTNYYVVGKVDLTDTNWVPVSPVITATGTQTTYCVTLPNTNHFFDVVVGSLPASPPITPPTLSSSVLPGGALVMNWAAPANSRFQVQWTPTIPANPWNTFPNIITASATNAGVGAFSFTDDGSQSGGLGPQRFYQLLQVP